MGLFGKTYEIKDIDGNILFKSNKVKSIKECAELAVKKKVSLARANLCMANLKGANLKGANFEGAKFWSENLENANLERANLKKADFWNSNLKKASLAGANFEKANFTEANLKEANLDNAKMREADFADTVFSSDEIKQDCLRKSQEGKEADKKTTDSEKIKNAQAMIKAAAMKNKQK
ncbi:MAG: pentapeptide repeat-containing protein [Alphaproteobacteria bacterium]|nr:pentapeptide repeat-containing protein [Alphaproteobacteria bacterium]